MKHFYFLPLCFVLLFSGCLEQSPTAPEKKPCFNNKVITNQHFINRVEHATRSADCTDDSSPWDTTVKLWFAEGWSVLTTNNNTKGFVADGDSQYQYVTNATIKHKDGESAPLVDALRNAGVSLKGLVGVSINTPDLGTWIKIAFEL